MGAAIVAGLEQLLLQLPLQQPDMEPEQRLQYWSSLISQQCHTGGDATPSNHNNNSITSQWLWDAWEAGPNHAQHSLEDILQCPVYEWEQLESMVPRHDVASHIRTALLLSSSAAAQVDDQEFVGLPGPHEVDSDEWMVFPDDDRTLQAMTTEQPSGWSGVVHGVDSFLQGHSDVHGVATSSSSSIINPTAFLRILHMTLHAPSADEMFFLPEKDPYFSEEDYELMQPDRDDDDDEGHDDDDTTEMKELMNAMDEEIRASRGLDVVDDDLAGALEENAILGERAHLLMNLLKSIESAEGGRGPVQSILLEGLQTPRTTPKID